MNIGLLVLLLLFLLIGIFLKILADKFVTKESEIVDNINKILPQTQCGQCGFPGCLPYARAIANNEAKINRCPPGGKTTITELANLLGQEAIPLDEECGEYKQPMVAKIREIECIGCTKCIQACPADAILGTNKAMHVVIPALCTGCELCIAPCPVDCIDMKPLENYHA